jgi:hypothetical protein
MYNRNKDLIKILVGCKNDLNLNSTEKEVSTKKAKKFAKQNGFVLFFQTSSKDNLNIKELYEQICLELITNYVSFLNYQQSLIDFIQSPCTETSPLTPMKKSIYALSTKTDVYFNCKTENLNFNHVILNNMNSKRKNLQSGNSHFFDFTFF